MLSQASAILFLFALLASCESTQLPVQPASAPVKPGAISTTRELVLYRPGNSTFYVQREGADAPYRSLTFGARGDIPLWADFNGDGKVSPGLYRSGRWLISSHADGIADTEVDFGGEPGDIPLVGDLDGDGKADLIIYRSGTWIVRGTRNPAHPFELHFGANGDLPLLADFNGDGKLDLAVYRVGNWFVDTHRDGKGDITFAFGGERDDRPLAFDWNGDGKAVPILFRDGEWLVSGLRDGKASAKLSFGAAGDLPVVITVSK
jgi:hypothetical protein